MFTIISMVGICVAWFFTFTKSQRMTIGRSENWTCQHIGCNKSFQDGWMVEIDHIEPLSNGGHDDEANGQVLCLQHHYEKHLNAGEFEAAKLILARIRRNGHHTFWWNGQGS